MQSKTEYARIKKDQGGILATVDEIIEKAGGQRPSQFTKNIILENPVDVIWKNRGARTTVTAVGTEGEHARCASTRDFGWRPVEELTIC